MSTGTAPDTATDARRRPSWMAFVAVLVVALLAGAFPLAGRADAEEIPPDGPPPEEQPGPIPPTTSPNRVRRAGRQAANPAGPGRPAAGPGAGGGRRGRRGGPRGCRREMAAYLGEVKLAEKRKEITKQQADKLRNFGAKVLSQLVPPKS